MRGKFVESILEVPSLVLLYNSHQYLIGNDGPRRALLERPGSIWNAGSKCCIAEDWERGQAMESAPPIWYRKRGILKCILPFTSYLFEVKCRRGLMEPLTKRLRQKRATLTFPGIDLNINLMPGAAPVYKVPYRMSTLGLIELKMQLQ